MKLLDLKEVIRPTTEIAISVIGDDGEDDYIWVGTAVFMPESLMYQEVMVVDRVADFIAIQLFDLPDYVEAIYKAARQLEK